MKANIEDKGKSGIYMIINLVNEKVYIGKAKCIFKRIRQHITSLNNKVKSHENNHLISSWHKYGKGNFQYKVVEYLELNETILKEKELFYIRKYNSLNSKIGYNKRLDSETGLIVSSETRAKLRKAQSERDIKFPHLKKQIGDKVSQFWKDNPDKLKEARRKVGDKIRKYKIGKFKKDTNIIIEIFNSREELQYIHPEYYTQAILGCCQGRKRSYKRFSWKYLDKITNEIIIK